ncbi:hypothetical protein K1T71_013943 [Dendrolimus kikuchii]|uniref:Uncharacterized protein n=1 Tax=Dendrolimus kikuchii TaxID=765133 RepID=A0ACC1CGK3_9NEOP|nr:hypothetical protein K1T71_013943 [Dendrolimus kikuchii]
MVLGLILMTGASVTASILVLQMAVIPLIFKYSKCVQRKMVFSNCINYPRNPDYENPSNCNIVGGRNFSLEFMSVTDQQVIKLGSAIAANMLANLNDLCDKLGKERLPQPDGLVLEAPFNNLKDEIQSHPLSKLVSWLPYFKGTFVKPFTVSPEYAFTTDQYLPKVPDVPILMMHSKGDKIVPYDLAVKLHTAIEESRRNSGGLLVFHAFDKGLGLGHNSLCEAHNLQDIIRHTEYHRYAQPARGGKRGVRAEDKRLNSAPEGDSVNTTLNQRKRDSNTSVYTADKRCAYEVRLDLLLNALYSLSNNSILSLIDQNFKLCFAERSPDDIVPNVATQIYFP